MTTSLKLRRGTTAQHATFTGAEGEVTVDTTKDTVVVHDGATAGGFPLAKRSDLTAPNVSFQQLGSSAVARTVDGVLKEKISIKDFGAVGDGVADDTTALANARAYLASLATAGQQLPTLVFPAGIYKYSLSPNWAINKVRLESQGEVRMRYTGTGNAFIIDGAGQAMYGLYFGRFIIEAPSTAGHGVYIRVIQHSTFDFQVRGCGSTSSGIYVAFSVCSLFINPEVSVNDGGWYLGAKPYYGLYLTNYAVVGDNGACSYCTFLNPIIEGTQQGIYCHSALGNSFLGGTSEGITDTALIISAESLLNKFYSIDFEVNAGDVLCYGYENEFHGIDSNVYFAIHSGAKGNLIVGGRFKTLYLESGALDNTIVGARYNVYSGGSYSDNGTRTRATSLHDVLGNKHHNSKPNVFTVAGPASGGSYSNDFGHDIEIFPAVSGGSMSYLGLNRNGTGDGVGYSYGSVWMSPGDSVTFIYTGTLNLRVITR